MKTITGNVVSSKPISLSKAASTLSSFLSVDNGASKALCAYLRRASASFNELKQLHKDLKSSRSDRNPRHHGFEVSSGLEAAVDSSHRIENGERIKSSVNESKSGKKRRESRDRNENEQDGKTAMASGGNGDFEDVVGEDGKRRSDELKTEIEEKPSRRVEVDVKSSDRDESVVGIEKKKKKHKKKSKDGEDERDAEVGQSYGKSQTSANNGETEATEDFIENNVGRGKDRKKHKDKNNLGDEKRTKKDNDDETGLVELSTKDKKKKKKKKKNREEDDDDLQNNGGGAIEKEKMPVSDCQELKRKESKKRKNGDLEEGVDDGSEEQQGTKRRKRKS
ncbi:DEAD-box ATP-dependent RNA helicase 42-like isoform X1 [Cucurbita moschata]|uniref:DEAD-box ATP-dependent RNA helicase 42-like isoform X1 n=1 Tax=Cucurbita moschata TaxID=3662 RepID=A0A6J1G5Q5_CUCMO|nr:DEAD-box ATP-dependent RNA helicase 42-like isoform X1 [Cucurbita moschata]XP_022947114.1 DEAD-box ATP-dependent RNA helicase 42-like isoform X1 [Cucurbita moschata]